LIKLRKQAFPKLSDSFKKYCDLLTGKKEDASLMYLPDSSLEEGEEEYRNFFVKSREKDRQFGSTRRGPHRDDFELCINGRNAKTFASEGQQKGLVLGLRFAEFDFLRNELKVVPIILADDILGELDPERRKNFNNLIPSDVQFFGTGTEFPFLDNSEEWQILKVKKGNFSL
jgi:DNA replication and repair protein RecF